VIQRRLELAVLGRPEVRLDRQPLNDQLPGKQLALLVYLAATGQPHTRQRLAELLWGDTPDDNAKNSLRVALTSLRKLLPDHLQITQQTVALRLDSAHWFDIAELRARTEALDSANADALRPVLTLYRDEFLHAFYAEASTEWEEWVLAQRAYWQQCALQALERLSDLLLAARDTAGAWEVLQRRIQIDPWQEQAHRQIMQFHGRSGNLTAALAHYERLRRMLDAELGVEPMPETVVLAERIEAARQAPPRPLPAEPGAFIGRMAELDRLHQLLLDPACRLITIVGLGGMGKTRLALEAARRANQAQALEFLNGVTWVSLVGVESAARLPQTLAQALEVPLAGRTDSSVQLLHYLRHKELLLVLDNLEHLLPAGVELMRQILDRCPAIKLLVTSRQPLRLEAEWRLDLHGLDYATTDTPTLEAHSATHLFVQAAQRVRPEFAITAQNTPPMRRLSQLVAGMPLALQLAATWLRVMSIEQIVAEVEQGLDLLTTRFHDIPERQRSVRAIFDATWALLDVDQQRALAALSVFRGGFTQEAAQAVVGTTPLPLATLVDRSLVIFRQNAPGARYELHELLRQYAAQHLAAMGAQAAVAERHSDYYLRLLAGQEAGLYSVARPTVMATLRGDLENVRQAWQWAVAQAGLATLQPSVEALAAFYQFAGLLQDGQQIFLDAYSQLESHAALGQMPQPESNAFLRHLRSKMVWFALQRGRHAAARDAVEALLSESQRAGDDRRIADAYAFKGYLSYVDGARDQALAFFTEAVERYRALNEQRIFFWALWYWVPFSMGGDAHKLAWATEYYEQVLMLARASGNSYGIAFISGRLGSTYSWAGYPIQAEPHFQEAFSLFEALGDLQGLSRTLWNAGYNDYLLARYQQALARMEQALLYSRQLGERVLEASIYDDLATVYFDMGRYDQAERHYRLSLDLCRELSYTPGQARVLIGFGQLALAQGDHDQARQWLHEAGTLAHETNQRRYGAEAKGYLGQLYAAWDDAATALRYLDEGLAELGQIAARYEFGYFLIDKAALLWNQGRAGEAQPIVIDALERFTAIGHRPLLTKARLLATNIALALGDTAAAEVQYIQSCKDLPERSDGPETAQALLYAAQYLVATQRLEEGLPLLAALASDDTAAHATRHSASALLDEYGRYDPQPRAIVTTQAPPTKSRRQR
jgi:predicted ATPase/DNA-binding SARP family transcriptional activator